MTSFQLQCPKSKGSRISLRLDIDLGIHNEKHKNIDLKLNNKNAM